jgi:acyl carrier protein
MTAQDILAQVNEVFRAVLSDPKLSIRPETTAKDVPEWDSLTHVELVVAIEKRFQIKFTAREVRRFQNVGEMCETIAQKLAA